MFPLCVSLPRLFLLRGQARRLIGMSERRSQMSQADCRHGGAGVGVWLGEGEVFCSLVQTPKVDLWHGGGDEKGTHSYVVSAHLIEDFR